MRRLQQLDGLRGIAILMVFATHALHIPGLWMGVDLFFVLSGFLITRILLHSKVTRDKSGYWRPFYIRRAQRILPPYLGFLIFAALVLAFRWQNSWLYYLCFASNFPSALGTVPIVAVTPLWSLAVEEQFYFAWPWVVRFCNARVLRRTAVAVLVGAPVLRALATPFFHNHMPIYTLTPFRADTLACGAFIAISENEWESWSESNKWAGFSLSLASLLALFGLSTMFPWFRTGANTVLFNTAGYSLSTLMFGGLLVYSLAPSETIQRILSWSGLRYLGRISYTFYLYHVAILYLLERRIHARIALTLVSFAVTTSIAALSWHLIESPILKRRQERRLLLIEDASANAATLVSQGSAKSATA